MNKHEQFLNPEWDKPCYVLVSGEEPITHNAESVIKVFDSREDAEKERRKRRKRELNHDELAIATVERVPNKDKEEDNVQVRSLVKRLHSLVKEANINDDFSYPSTNMILESDGTLILVVYIKDDGELTHVYERAVAEFGAIADDISLRFDDMEKEGKKHWVDIKFENIIEVEE